MFTTLLIATFVCGSSAWFSPWNAWSPCSSKCGEGVTSRERITKHGKCYGELRQTKVCNLGACRAPTNLATEGSVNASSEFLKAYPASNAVDGKTSPDFYAGGCMMTNKDEKPWLRIKLEKTAEVTSVNIFKRGDCCSERINYLTVTVGRHPEGNSNQLCGTIDNMKKTNMTKLKCVEALFGQYIHLRIPGPQFLSICEVEVLGTYLMTTASPTTPAKPVTTTIAPVTTASPTTPAKPVTTTIAPANIALGKPVTAEKLFDSTPPAMVVDGDVRTYFYTKCSSNNPYVRIDLGKEAKVFQVHLYMGCCLERITDTIISVGGAEDDSMQQCGVVNQPTKKGKQDQDYYEIICEEPLKGRYVKAQLKKDNWCFSTNEMEVYGLFL